MILLSYLFWRRGLEMLCEEFLDRRIGHVQLFVIGKSVPGAIHSQVFDVRPGGFHLFDKIIGQLCTNNSILSFLESETTVGGLPRYSRSATTWVSPSVHLGPIRLAANPQPRR